MPWAMFRKMLLGGQGVLGRRLLLGIAVVIKWLMGDISYKRTY